ncbi:MAG: aspartate aminotransferase family protein, partial [Chloroflexi bacterium]|nr:aspartate aminotransferase family protein [Chloroflexota bacterium]
KPQAAEDTLHLLDTFGSPATVASTGGQYFGFVIGGALPVTQAASWLATIWDQNAAFFTTSPIAAKIEEVALRWLVDLFQFPSNTAGAFVTGATMANFTALAAARHAILERQGWDVEAQGLFGAPEIKLVVGDEVHVSLLKALSLLGLGRDRVIRVPVDNQGRMIPGQLPPLDDRTIVCVQAGNVNSGAVDPVRAVVEKAQLAGAWVHVDGAFGLWALALPALSELVDGVSLADSWAADAHKWLNIPYDSGIALCKHPQHLRAAMSTSAAAYLTASEHREPAHFVPELSRRARGIEIWAALRTLGREGIAELVERNCRSARQLADGLREAGYTIHNDVVLNQVVVSFGTAEVTGRVINAIQQEGKLWAGQTVWQGHTALRLSVSSWATTDQDIAQSLEAILETAHRIRTQDN